MPTEYKVYPQMLKTIESIQKSMKRSTFQSFSDNDKRNLYASVFGARFAANAERSKKSLDVPIDAEKLGEARNQLYAQGGADSFFDEASRTILKDATKAAKAINKAIGKDKEYLSRNDPKVKSS